MRRALLIYDMCPDAVKVYQLDLSVRDFNTLKKCHGVYGNRAGNTPEQDDLAQWLNDFLDNYEPCFQTEGGGPLKLEESITVIMAGFLL